MYRPKQEKGCQKIAIENKVQWNSFLERVIVTSFPCLELF